MQTIANFLDDAGSWIILLILFLFTVFYFIKRFAVLVFPIVRYNYRIILGLTTFSVLTVFGINSDTFVDYDHATKPPYHYDWMNFNHILKFPFEAHNTTLEAHNQLKIELLDNNKLDKKINCIMVLDKTGSTDLGKSSEKNALIKKLKASIKSPLGNIKPKDLAHNIPEIDKLKDLRDLYCLSFIHSIYAAGYEDISYQIVFYMGEVNGEGVYVPMIENDDKDRPNKNELAYGKAVKAFVTKLSSLESREEGSIETDLNQMIRIFSQSAYLENDDDRENYLVWLSDFKDYSPDKPNINGVSTDDIRFILLKSGDHLNKVSAMRNSLNHSLSSVSYETEMLSSQDMKAWLRFREEPQKAIYFFYPNHDRYGKYFYTAKLDLQQYYGRELYFRFTSSNALPDSSTFLEYNGTRLNMDKCTRIMVNGNNLFLFGQRPLNTFIQEPLHLEIIDPKTLMSKRYPIAFLGYIPTVYSTILGTSYLIILFLLATNSVLYVYFYFNYKCYFMKKFEGGLKDGWLHLTFVGAKIIESLIGLYLIVAFVYYWIIFQVPWHFKILWLLLGILYLFFFLHAKTHRLLKKDLKDIKEGLENRRECHEEPEEGNEESKKANPKSLVKNS